MDSDTFNSLVSEFQCGDFLAARNRADSIVRGGVHEVAVVRILAESELKLGNSGPGFHYYKMLASQLKDAESVRQLLLWFFRMVTGYTPQGQSSPVTKQFKKEEIAEVFDIILKGMEVAYTDAPPRVAITEACYYLGRLSYVFDETLFDDMEKVCRDYFRMFPPNPSVIVENISTDQEVPRDFRIVAYPLALAGYVEEAEEFLTLISTTTEPEGDAADLFTTTANSYDTSPQILRTTKRLLALAEGTGNLGTVLDLGCGTGAVGHLLSGRSESVTGIDLQKDRVEVARNKGVYDSLVVGDVLTAELPVQSFDTVICSMLVQAVADLGKLLGRINALLRPGGVVYFDSLTCAGEASPRYIFAYRLRTRGDIHKMVNQNGFDIVHERVGAQQFAVGSYLAISKS